ncbi:MAG: Crp/Fnr family transcriptional regulator [Planctomycetaceae bacterium]|nr:Crp/Fnr family transcriptional regulator [Planctomycetaceae bacterium]
MSRIDSLKSRVLRSLAPAFVCAGTASLLLALDSFNTPPATGAEARAAMPKVLVFSRTAGFRHGSIPAGIKSLVELGREHGFRVEATEDPKFFEPARLGKTDCVVFLNTTGDVLDDEQQKHFENFIRGGGGYVGVHSAADTEYDWPWYGKLVGAWFKTHPAIQPARINVEDRTFPATRMLPAVWDRTDEWYVYRENPRPHVRVLMSLDETSYRGGGMDGDHPISWYHDYDGGRAFYTGGGHTDASYSEPLFRDHLAGAIKWAAGMTPHPPKKPAPPADTSAGSDRDERR